MDRVELLFLGLIPISVKERGYPSTEYSQGSRWLLYYLSRGTKQRCSTVTCYISHIQDRKDK